MKVSAALFPLSVVMIMLFACQNKEKAKAPEDKYDRTTSVTLSEPSVSSRATDDRTMDRKEPHLTTAANSSGNSDYKSGAFTVTAGAAENMPANSDQFISSIAAVENGKDTSRKFIRTADMKFKVKSVFNSTYAIENTVSDNGGFVINTNLSSNIDNKTVVAISADSSLETTYYTVVNTLVLRVPNTKLDTTLKAIGTLIDYLDYRNIKAEDVSLQLLSNKLAQDRLSKSGKRLANDIDNNARKLGESASAEEQLLNKQEQADETKIASLTMFDRINLSTINVYIYQRQSVKREVIANYKDIDAYTPALGSRIWEAFKSGWRFFEGLAGLIAEFWWLFILIIMVFVIYKRYQHRISN